MWPTLHKLACSTAACATAFLFSGMNSQQAAPQSPASSAAATPHYFPPGAVNGFAEFFASYLTRVGEPSLLIAAQEPEAILYRFESMAGQTGRTLAVRLSLNPDGSARIFTAEEFGTPRSLHRTENNVAPTDVNRLLQLVDRGRFWSMATIEPENRDLPRRAYKTDASTWVFEGVRNAGYHVVLRRGPEPGRFTEMVRFLLRDLAKLDESAIPRTFPAS
jgi:hypothetical protein